MASTKSNSSTTSKQETAQQGGSNSTTASATQGGSTSTTSSSTQYGSTTNSHTEGGSHSETSGKSWLSGKVDAQTAANRNQYFNEYKPSDNVLATQQRLQETLTNKPGAFSSSYQGKLDDLYNQITNREPFKYNFLNDPMYQMYKGQYTQQGQNAMRDTIGQASALSGGYSNSYAQTAGQQQYQNYLQQLNNVIPELRQQALEEYKSQGEDLYNQANLANQMYNNEYQKYRGDVSDWQTDRSFNQAAYQDERNFDWNKYSQNRSFWNDEYWKEKSAETSNRSTTDSTNWSDTTSETNGWSNTNSTTNTSNWSNTLSNTASNNWSNSVTNGQSNTSSSSFSSGSGGSGGGSSKTSTGNGFNYAIDRQGNITGDTGNNGKTSAADLSDKIKKGGNRQIILDHIKNEARGNTTKMAQMLDTYSNGNKTKKDSFWYLTKEDAAYLAYMLGL